ncbi:MAG: CotH kinase family protein [Clostridia bacterium]|nr:CotH kinase family protein [Clostridia bacterium]
MIAVFMFISVLGNFYVDATNSISSVRVIINTENGVEDISLYEKNNIYYAFLPSYVDVNKVHLESSLGYSVYINDVNCNGCDTVALEKDKEYILTLKNILGISVSQCTFVIKQSQNIPALSIHLADGTIDDINKNVNIQKSGIVSLITADSAIDYSGAFAVMEGRGNSSWGQAKKPYNLKFNKAVSLLGMNSSFNWVLVANAMDESGIRNKIVYDTALNAGLENSVESRYVDLYVDGEYLGLYLLAERIEVSESRINITDLYSQTQRLNQYRLDTYGKVNSTVNGVFQKAFAIPNNPSDITGGYLLEFELSGRVEQEHNLFKTISGQNITVKSPKNASVSQMGYISSFAQQLENSLGTDEIFNFIDATSWARYYLIQEFFANCSRTSFFFYKDKDSVDGKLYAGPIWDFDLSIGTNYGSPNTNPLYFYINNWGWFKELWNNPSFYSIIVSEYKNTLRPIFADIVQTTAATYSDTIKASYEMNELRWEDDQYNWWVNRYETQSQHVEYIENYLQIRLSMFDDIFLNNISHETILENNSNEDIPPDDSTNSSLNPENSQHQTTSGGIVNKVKTLLRKAYNNLNIIIVGVMVLVVLIAVSADCIPAIKRRFRRGKSK